MGEDLEHGRSLRVAHVPGGSRGVRWIAGDDRQAGPAPHHAEELARHRQRGRGRGGEVERVEQPQRLLAREREHDGAGAQEVAPLEVEADLAALDPERDHPGAQADVEAAREVLGEGRDALDERQPPLAGREGGRLAGPARPLHDARPAGQRRRRHLLERGVEAALVAGPAVKEEDPEIDRLALDVAGGPPASDAPGALDHEDAAAGGGEGAGTGEAGDPGADHEDRRLSVFPCSATFGGLLANLPGGVERPLQGRG